MAHDTFDPSGEEDGRVEEGRDPVRLEVARAEVPRPRVLARVEGVDGAQLLEGTEVGGMARGLQVAEEVVATPGLESVDAVEPIALGSEHPDVDPRHLEGGGGGLGQHPQRRFEVGIGPGHLAREPGQGRAQVPLPARGDVEAGHDQALHRAGCARQRFPPALEETDGPVRALDVVLEMEEAGLSPRRPGTPRARGRGPQEARGPGALERQGLGAGFEPVHPKEPLGGGHRVAAHLPLSAAEPGNGLGHAQESLRPPQALLGAHPRGDVVREAEESLHRGGSCPPRGERCTDVAIGPGRSAERISKGSRTSPFKARAIALVPAATSSGWRRFTTGWVAHSRAGQPASVSRGGVTTERCPSALTRKMKLRAASQSRAYCRSHSRLTTGTVLRFSTQSVRLKAAVCIEGCDPATPASRFWRRLSR